MLSQAHDLGLVFRCHRGCKAFLQPGISTSYWGNIMNAQDIEWISRPEDARCRGVVLVCRDNTHYNSPSYCISGLIRMLTQSCSRRDNISLCQPCIRGTHLYNRCLCVHVIPLTKDASVGEHIVFLGFYSSANILWACVLWMLIWEKHDRSYLKYDLFSSAICWPG